MFFEKSTSHIFLKLQFLYFIYRTANFNIPLESTLAYKSNAQIYFGNKSRTSEKVRLRDIAVYSDPRFKFNLLSNFGFYCLFNLELPTI
jgi:hypothetical protein